jgi:hypothetical protein
LIAPPSFATPRMTSMMPAMIVATVSPSMPYFWMTP